MSNLGENGKSTPLISLREAALSQDHANLFRFVQFFEQLALMAQNEFLDRSQMQLLFGPYFKFYADHLLRPLGKLP